jgi:hypothetical protein
MSFTSTSSPVVATDLSCLQMLWQGGVAPPILSEVVAVVAVSLVTEHLLLAPVVATPTIPIIDVLRRLISLAVKIAPSANSI